jgi:competence protein ComEC
MNNRIHTGALISVLVALFLGAALVQGESSSDGGITITNANFVAPSPEKENLNEEWVEVANNGTIDENLAGWVIQDQQNHTYVFPDFNLKAGATVKIHSGTGSNSDEDLYWNRSTSIWNNGGDLATLVDASGFVISSYPKEVEGA